MRIELTGIYKAYPTPSGVPLPVLDNITLALPPGITCLMGPSGIGKTTLAHILAGLITPDKGEITGREGKRVSMVFQEDRLLTGESALTNILLVTPSTKEACTRAAALLHQVGLGDAIHKKTAELSGGMKRRVALCRALAAPHNLLILDEPFKGLDEQSKQIAMDTLRTHAQTGDIIVLCVTHDPGEAEALGGQIARI